jgi:2-polyprenyl-3-methyl-5-hydroxy-6-metoxy-1,4-benzoquinol methylase
MEQSQAMRRAIAMPCASYTDPRLAAIYDHLNPPGKEDGFHAALAGAPPSTILDMGCGTGRFACKLAKLGHRVTGADPAGACASSTRPGSPGISWMRGFNSLTWRGD